MVTETKKNQKLRDKVSGEGRNKMQKKYNDPMVDESEKREQK